MTKKILIIDDDANDLFLVEKAIKDSGIDVEIFKAETGQQGIKLANEGKLDLAVVDINLTDMKGYEVCQELKSQANSNLKTILFTGVLDSLDVIKAKYTEIDNYCIKTSGNTYLVEMIKFVLGDSGIKEDFSSFESPINTILLIDDDEADRALTEAAFINFNKDFNFIEVAGSIDALKVLEQNIDEVDLVVTSLNMLKIDGFQLIEKIKSDIKFKEMPILVLITQDVQEDTIKTYKRHNVRYIYKTPEHEELKKRVPGLIKK